MSEVSIRVEGCAGRITLTRPQALNALSHDMCRRIEGAIDAWRDDPAVRLVILDAEGTRAFCAGGDVAEVYRASLAGEPRLGRDFWREEYRMNAKLAEYPKPIVALMQGFVMGGGVGLGCHVRHRVLGETTRMAMPEAGIGLIPDVGGSLLLARAPGQLGAYLGLTAARMGPGDAVHAGFADTFVPEAAWPDLIAALCATGDPAGIADHAQPAPDSQMAAIQAEIDQAFAGPDVASILAALEAQSAPWAVEATAAIRRNSPLSMAATLALLRGYGPGDGIRQALAREYRFTWRASEAGATDFTEGVRAQIIDKDRQPKWRHSSPGAVAEEVAAVLAPLGPQELWAAV